MIRRGKVLLAIGIGATVIALTVFVIWNLMRARQRAPVVTLRGGVLKDDSDPAKQTPLPGVLVTATDGSHTFAARSGPSGLFELPMTNDVAEGASVVLTFTRQDYKPLKIVATHPGDQLYIARMLPAQPDTLPASQQPQTPVKTIQIRNTRVRYTLKEQSTINVGSLAKQFAAHNVGNVPCRGRPPCSPDGRWAAARTNLPLDAEAHNEFHNIRVLCVAGPCAFTKIESPESSRPARKITVSVLNWSDTTFFLVEADVIRTMETDAVQYSYPFTLGSTMNFALPPGAEGPSVEADLDGQYIVFPLGPFFKLEWATCTVEVSPQKNRIFRCQLKPGYSFQE